ncbi:putative type III effector protein XopAH [Xanthomonas bromi]|uniref:Putative type III effector protein XopAH n=1 Tax=Xanthomonas bromi TaxID=56449 RepID=A0A1C3NKF4_9XANT|nr:XopAH/AvrB family type III secretion system effector [Xanthomonas bromi]PPV07585.1 hypothetical protein XbrCFBP1976_06405 [Xanthomonas bromi]SBV50784.1 putative type III effector protein XopAH [Xanthomonas bromi]
MRINKAPSHSGIASGDTPQSPERRDAPQAPPTAGAAGPLSGLKRHVRKALPGLCCSGAKETANTSEGASHRAPAMQPANAALAGLEMALSRPGETVTVGLQRRRPSHALTPEQRTSSDAQLQLLYAKEQGARRLHIESSLFHEPGAQSVTTHGSKTLLKAAASAALAPGMQGLDHMFTSVSPPIRHALPGPGAESKLSPTQVALTGVARWPDPRVNQESTPANQRYGRRFHSTAREGGARLASGQIQTFRQLWDFAGAARHSWATQQTAQTAGPGNPKLGNAQPFAAGYPRQTDVGTPLTKHYAYMRPRVRQLPLVRKANDLVADTGQPMPDGFMAHDVFEMVGELNGEKIGLTQLGLAVNPDDFHHPRARQGRERHDGRIETSAFPFFIQHTSCELVQPIMNHVEHLFGDLVARPHDPAELMPALGNLHWWMAHAMPDPRGSAAKTELAIRALANAHGVELPPFARGNVPDLEAFVTDRESFSARYADLFERPDHETAASPRD